MSLVINVLWCGEYSDDGERMVMLGMSAKGRILLICYCYRRLDTIRIFSGRKANSNEKRGVSKELAMMKQEKQWSEDALIPNPFADKLCCEVSLNLPKSVVAYFSEIGQKAGWPAERIIEIYLRNIEFTGDKIPLDLPDWHA